MHLPSWLRRARNVGALLLIATACGPSFKLSRYRTNDTLYAAAMREEDGVGRTTILVSHRFSTVRMADLIVVLDGARVVESGTHEALMARSGQYAQLYSIQAAAYR